MTKKPTPGGRVQISGRQYDVLGKPVGHLGYYTLKVRHEDGTELMAEAPAWQGGKGPWKISAPVLRETDTRPDCSSFPITIQPK